MTVWRIFLSLLLIIVLFSCRSTIILVLDDPAFMEDMVQAALDGKKFYITEEDYPGIRRLLVSTDPVWRRAGLLLADQTEDEQLYPDIFARVSDEDEEVSTTADDIIGAHSEAFRLFLIERLDDPDTAERAQVIMVLSRIGGEDLVPAIIHYFDYPDIEVRNQASLAVSRLADRNNPFLRDALSSESVLKSAMAYRTLGRYTHLDDLPLFIEAFVSPEAEIRKEAQAAALRIREAGLPLLHATAMDSLEPIESRLTALNVIQGLRFPESLRTLWLLLEDPIEKIRIKSDAILGTYGSEVIPELINLYQQSDEAYQIHAIRLMGEIGSEDAIPTLLLALDEDSAALRETAVSSLESFGSEAWPALRNFIDAGEPGIGTVLAMEMLRSNRDEWLIKDENGDMNTEGLYLLVSASEKKELSDYLEFIDVNQLTKENLLNLKTSWIIAQEFVELEADIVSDPYFNLWRQRERLSTESRKLLEQSFTILHEYFDTRESELLKQSKTLREQSLTMGNEAQQISSRLEQMPELVRRNGQLRRVRYEELRDELVETWHYIEPDLRELAIKIYADRDIDPEILSRESDVLN